MLGYNLVTDAEKGGNSLLPAAKPDHNRSWRLRSRMEEAQSAMHALAGEVSGRERSSLSKNLPVAEAMGSLRRLK